MLYQDDGTELTPKIVRMWIMRAEKKAGLPETGRIHKLRHTICSHAAMAGVPAMTIMGLARHTSLAMTMRYMHLSPSALDEGIDMLRRSREAGGTVVTSKVGRKRALGRPRPRHGGAVRATCTSWRAQPVKSGKPAIAAGEGHVG